MTGNAAVRIRVRALEASRAVISASTRVRRNSSGFQRWVLAVTSSSGARRRIAASFNRFSPAVRSAASGGCGGGHELTSPLEPPVARMGASRRSTSGRVGTVGRVSTSACPAGRGVGCGAGGGQDRADVGGPPPPERHRPLQRGEQRRGAVRGLQGRICAELGAAACSPRPRPRR